MKNKSISFRLICILLIVLMTAVLLPMQDVKAFETFQRGIDISQYQTVSDWNTVAQNVDFVILRVGTTTGLNNDTFRMDTLFESHYSGAVNAGIPVGVYYYSGATTKEGFIKNANQVVSMLDGRHLDYPVYLDLEQSSGQIALGKDALTSYALTALEIISNAGYKAGVYCNKNWFTNYVDREAITAEGYNIWMAQYPSGSYAVDPTNYDKSSICNMWQYSDKGSISGISGNVDVDVYYGESPVSNDEECGIPYPRPDGTNLLCTGCSGISVKWVQYALNLCGYNLEVDGIFGNRTASAIMDFQSRTGLEPDGIVGSQTINMLVQKILTPAPPDVWYHDMTPVDLGTEFQALIFNTPYWKALTIEPDNNVTMRTEAISASQLWRFVRQADGSYVIFNGDKVLDSTGGNAAGNNVYAYENYAASDAQQWYIYGVSGSYYFRSKTTDCVMDVYNNHCEDGTNIQMYTYHGGSAQQFQIWKVLTELTVTPGNKDNKTSLSWTCNTANTRYDVKIWQGETLWNGDAYHVEWNAFTPCEIALPAGTYTAYVDAVIEDQPVMSNAITFTIEENYNPADVNQDDQTTVLDIVLLQKYLLSQRSFTPLQYATADINADGYVDGFDLAILKRILLAK